ncbi:MAG: DNA replication protein DnaT [Kangiellaceae bacterium]
MNELELETLQTPLSNLARVLYCLYLRPQLSANSHNIVVNNKAILALINNKKPVITMGRQVSALFKELHSVGLIEVAIDTDFSKSLHNQKIALPLTALPQSLENPQFHSQHKSMRLDWRPIQLIFEDLCQLVGLIEKTYNADELGEFIAYWLGRIDTQCTEYQWTQKLVIHLKQRRQRLPLSEQKTKTGHQYVTPSAGIVFDDNVKQLINQYKDQI